MPIMDGMPTTLYFHIELSYNVCISAFLQVSKGKPLKFKRLEDFLKESHKKHHDETRIRRAGHRPAAPLPPAKNRLAFVVRIRE